MLTGSYSEPEDTNEVPLSPSFKGGVSALRARRSKRLSLAPCDRCREKHLKCEYGASGVCFRCKQNDEDCVRRKPGFKFRHGSTARYDKGFPKDQPWMTTGRALRGVSLTYVDETREVAASYSEDSLQHEVTHSEARPEEDFSDVVLRSMSDESTPDSNVNHRNSIPDIDDFELSSHEVDLSVPGSDLSHSGVALRDDLGHPPSSVVAPCLARSVADERTTLNGVVKPPSQLRPDSDQAFLETALLRYFIENLARWFDLCDPQKHFELVVPQRARTCPPLMNAIITAAARHVTRVEQYASSTHTPSVIKDTLPGLNNETAVHYHNKAIRDPIRLSMDPDQIHNENLLAAAIILRFHEEVDAPLRTEDQDSELFLRVINIFITEQAPEVPELPHSSPLVNLSDGIAMNGYDLLKSPGVARPHEYSASGGEPSPVSVMSRKAFHDPPRMPRPDGLRQAGFWVAFRQEIYTAFMKQRPFNIELSRCEAFRSSEPAEDSVWADRMIVFCADVLELCYGGSNGDEVTNTPLAQQTAARSHKWAQLSQREQEWGRVLPSSFEPLFYREADRSRGEVFPQIWYLSDCHVTGIQHVELARIILAVHDPARPKLGPRHVASMKLLSHHLTNITRRLCGIALSNSRIRPAFVVAYMAIAMCGDHFNDPMEQHGLLGLLAELQGAWPVGDTVASLKEIWGWSCT